MTRMLVILMLCGMAGSAISSCKKKEQKTATAEMAADTNKLRKQVKKKIKDKVRKENVLILVDDVDRHRAQMTLGWLEMQNAMQKNPTMSREEVEAEVAKFEQLRLEALRNMAKSRVAMRQFITEKEWKQLFPPPKKKTEDKKEDGETEEEAETAPEGDKEESEQPDENAAEAEAATTAPEKPESEE